MEIRLKQIIRWLPLVLIVGLIIAFLFTDLRHELSFSSIKEKHDALKAYAAVHPVLTPLIFMGIFALSVCLIIPDALFLSIIAGWLFPKFLALLYIGIAEAVGATVFFFSIYEAFGQKVSRKDNPTLQKLEKNLKKNEASYLLFLRISHVVPYWMINAACACLGVRFWTFFWTACIGFLPIAYVCVIAGEQLEKLFHAGAVISFRAIFTTNIQIALVLLAVLALAPIFLKKLWHKK